MLKTTYYIFQKIDFNESHKCSKYNVQNKVWEQKCKKIKQKTYRKKYNKIKIELIGTPAKKIKQSTAFKC